MEDESDNRNSLSEQLESLPIVDLLGVVSPRGGGGWRSRDEVLWTFLLTFDAWRDSSNTIHYKPLHIRQRVTEEELHRLQQVFIPYTVVHIKARVEKSISGVHEALLEAFVEVNISDEELNDHAEELQKPVTFEDSIFGIFTLDRQPDWFTAEVVWDGNKISLYLSDLVASDFVEVQEALKTARTIWQNQSYWDQKIRDYAVQQLLNLKNNDWLDEDEVELSPNKFKDRMILESIKVCPNGSFDFYFDDGDLFWGHSIEISGSLLEGMTYADIIG